jgi:pullulanase
MYWEKNMFCIRPSARNAFTAMCLFILTSCSSEVSENEDDIDSCIGSQQAQCDTPVAVGPPDPVFFPADNEAVVYLNRGHIDGSYDEWVLHLWNGCGDEGWASQVTASSTAPTDWPMGPTVNGEGIDPIYGAYWVLSLAENASCGNFIIHQNGNNQTNDFSLTLDSEGEFARMAFVIGSENMRNATISNEPVCQNPNCDPSTPPIRSINNAAAHWIDAQTLVWNNDGSADQLFFSTTGGLSQNAEGDITGSEFSASLTPTTLSEEQQQRVPHLSSWPAYSINDLDEQQIKTGLRGQIWATGSNASGELIGTEVQTPRVLDAIYTMGENDADEATLGIQYEQDNITVSVWAPTAHNVTLKVFDASSKNEIASRDMLLDPNTGIWSYTGARAALDRNLYRFHVSLYDRSIDNLVITESADPYSVAASADSEYSMFVNLNDADTQPEGWGSVDAPALAAPETMIIYESHVRDFSIFDESTSVANRGKYLAFTESNTQPLQHLAELQASGLTHFHTLPTNDFLTVPENPENQIALTDTVATLCNIEAIEGVCGVESDEATLLSLLESYSPTSDESKDLINAIRQFDGFNWGYDPVLYNVPEGSYASTADGIARIREMRAMNQAINQMGLRTVMDVVFNHTIQSGLIGRGSTFDKIVPGYYFRRDALSGAIENASGAGNDTATENRMFAKFITDSVVHWAEHYGYNDFRFDLMTFIPKKVMVDTLAQVRSEVREDTYFYGEGWNMPGSSANDAIFARAEQFNMAGTGIGTFNDRMRDPMRFLALIKGENVDRIRIGLAGNLKDYQLYNSNSQRVTADTIGAYTDDPQESVNYVSKHDNETLWDMIQKEGAVSPTMSASDRARIQNMTIAMTVLSQGVPFIHMGSDLLRSKSMDRNTFDASDWYNRVDFTQTTQNWAVGMPLDIGDASEEWVRSQFNHPNTAASASDIMLASDVFNEFVQIAQSSPLFSLETLAEVQARVGFHNTGSNQVDGMIAMSLDDGIGLGDIDTSADAIVVVFNGNDTETSVDIRSASGFELHPIQRNSADSRVQVAQFEEQSRIEDDALVTYGSFTVPALSAAVFIKPQNGVQGEGLDADATTPSNADVARPYNVVPFLRGEMNDWSTDTPFIYNGDGTYTAFAQLEAQSYPFKFASADWETVNFGAISADQASVTLNEETLLAVTNDNLIFTASVAAEYRFTVNAENPQSPTLTISPADVYENAIFLKGSFNDWADEFEMVYVGEGIYRAPLTLSAGDIEFKIADSTWSSPNLGAGDAGSRLSLNSNLALIAADNSGNIQLSVENTDDYVFTLDTRDAQRPIVHLTPSTVFGAPVFVRGSMNGWSTNDVMTERSNNVFQADINLSEGGYEWKIASEDWNTVDLTAAGLVELLTPVSFVSGAGQPNSTLVIDENAVYRFVIDAHFAPAKVTVFPLPSAQ